MCVCVVVVVTFAELTLVAVVLFCFDLFFCVLIFSTPVYICQYKYVKSAIH